MKKTLIVLAIVLTAFVSEAQHLKGYSIGHLFHPFPGHKVNQEAINLFDELGPDVLRFPGGTIGNKYHFYKPGYGWSKADSKRSENYIVEYVRVVKAMKSQPKTIYVFNLFDHFKGANEANLIKENMAALQYLLDNGMDVVAVELGNEMYLYNEIIGLPGITSNPELNNIDAIETGNVDVNQNNPNPKTKNNTANESVLIKWLRTLTGKFSGGSGSKELSGKSYASKSSSKTKSVNQAKFEKFERLAKIYHDKIKAIDPTIKTGVPFGNLSNKKHAEYNNYMISHFGFADAWVAHFYGSFNKNCKEGDLACVEKGLEWSLNNSTIPALKYLTEKSDKEIWITEWNAIKFGHWGDESTWVRNSSVQKKYIKKYIEVFDKYGVTISNFHKLAGHMENAAYNVIDVDKGKCYPTPIYQTLKQYY